MKRSSWPPRCDLQGRRHAYNKRGVCRACRRLSDIEKKKRRKITVSKYNAKNKKLLSRIAANYYVKNKAKIDLANKEWRKKHPERYAFLVKKNKLLRKYGLTFEQYTKMVKDQKGKCALCKKLPSRELCIDHNHGTNKVRGILCHPCNLRVGHIESALSVLPNILNYIKRGAL